jgi:putative endonuclease
MPSTTHRRKTYDLGHRAEFWAGLYCRAKGYQILQKRYKTRFGEIDLVLKRGKTLVFLEVKARRSVEEALQSIHRTNRGRIEKSALMFMANHAELEGCSQRFDCIGIVFFRNLWPIRFVHLDNAWLVGA